MSEVSPGEASGPAATGDDSGAMASLAGVSPYVTGGGGVTFERNVAVQYLAHLLVGDGAVELGDGRRVVSVAFQQAPAHAVDDLVVHAARADEHEPSLVLLLGVRRAPRIVSSDEDTRKLIRQFVRAVIDSPEDGPEHRWGLVVAGSQRHAEQLAKLAAHAAVQMDAPGFFDLIQTPTKFDAGVRGRLDQLQRLVETALYDLGEAEVDSALVQCRTWQLLSRLSVLMPRLESPDETDWSAVENSLISVARDSDLAEASRLRDRLVALAAEYSPRAARVDLTMLRRAAHEHLDTAARRHRQGWQALDHFRRAALASVGDKISDGGRSVHLDRSGATAELAEAAAGCAAVVVTGESGVGKSSLALSLAASGATDPDTVQVLCLNLRHVPTLTIQIEEALGHPLSVLLSEMSAPSRMLIVDGADAIAEGGLDAFRYLVDAARESDVTVVAVCAVDTRQVVQDSLADRVGAGVTEYGVPPLTDAEIEEIVGTFPELGNLNANPRSRELLRRLVVVDLFVRGHVSGVPLTDADAMDEVWSGLVRRHEASDRGFPDARELVLLSMAALELSGGDRLDALSGIDQTALDGLRRDGLLRTSVDSVYMIGPEFAHDELRRYAVARLLLGDDVLASRILEAGAPRWSLAAARLACQAWLARPESAQAPLRGRLKELQASFDAFGEAGHGARWGDVPGEALLTLGDPGALLRDAWPGLRADDDAGLRQLARLVGQRLRDGSGIVDLVAVEPIITLLLGDDAPWRSGEHAEALLRDWLQAHVVAETPVGQPLRVLLRTRLVKACDEADRRLAEQLEAEAAAREESASAAVEDRRPGLPGPRVAALGVHYGFRGRSRPPVPYEITQEIVLELLALLGPDLGNEGETVLRRVARDAPSELAPAIEELLTDRSLANGPQGLLAHLTEAYYLDDEANDSGFFEYGVRHHRSRSIGVLPQAAWFRGPFMVLLQTDFRDGVAVLNRLLNHAALIRARTPGEPFQWIPPLDDEVVAASQIELSITGTRCHYVGDAEVWCWYRGTGAGPHPCSSALQALERACDQLIDAGAPIGIMVSILLDSCENLAMVGLVVGILVRHLEEAEDLLDQYLAEPLIWEFEFVRAAGEASGLAAGSEGLAAPERRNWSLREVAGRMILLADDERAETLGAVRESLVANARRLIEPTRCDGPSAGQDEAEESLERELAKFRGWASALNRDRYRLIESSDGLRVQAMPPEDVTEALRPEAEEMQRAHDHFRLLNRYLIRPADEHTGAIGAEQLAVDIATARELLENPPPLSADQRWDTPAMVAAAALEAHLTRGVDLSPDALAFAAETVLQIGEGEAWPREDEIETTYFEQGADRSAARVLPLLLLPKAERLRGLLDGADGQATLINATAAGHRLAQAVAYEVQLHLARGLDHLWDTPCAEDSCHHGVGLQLATETMRDCVLGIWDPAIGGRRVVMLDEPLTESLANTSDNSIRVSKLDAAIRALAPAAVADICVSAQALSLVMALLDAQRRSLLSRERDNLDSRGTHTLVGARALLTLAGHGDDAAVYTHIDAYADNSALLANLLQALSAAAEESRGRAETARWLWPRVVRRVLDLNDSEHTPFEDHHHGDMALAALVPSAANKASYLYREVQDEPIKWWDPLALRREVETWLEVAAGNPICVDKLVIFLGTIAPEDQARMGLPWVATLVLADPVRVARESWILSDWLIEMRPAVADVGLEAMWQQVVDALVVAGVQRLAPYSE